MADNRSCETCIHDEKSEFEYPCSRCIHNAEDKYEPIQKPTNADRIRAMSDEEMSTDLVNIFEELFEDGVPSPERMKMWLQSEVE